MAIITISRSFGLYEEELLKEFALKHDYNFMSHELLIEVAKKIEEPVERVKEIYSMENFSSFKIFLTELLQSMKDSSSLLVTGTHTDAPEFFPLYYSTLRNDEELAKFEERKSYIDLMRQVIEDIAKKKNVIIIGRGSQLILKDHANTIHLRLEGNHQDKVLRIAEKETLDEKEAALMLKKINRNRKEYIAHFYDETIDSPELYHYIINIDKLGKNRLFWFLENIIAIQDNH